MQFLVQEIPEHFYLSKSLIMNGTKFQLLT